MAQKATSSSPLLAGIVRLLIAGFARLSVDGVRRCGRGIGTLLWLLPNQFRGTAIRNIDRCFPELSAADRKRLARESLASVGLNAAEAGAMWCWPADRLRQLEGGVDGEASLRAAMEKGRGVLLLVPHVGNWEFFAHYLGSRFAMMAIYRPPRIAELDELIRRSRERLGAEMVPADSAGLRRAVKGLSEGRLIVILPDQEPLKRHGVFAPFFGVPALTMTLVSRLVRRYEPEVMFAYAERRKDGRFLVRFLAAPDGLGDADPVRAAGRLNYGVERCVRSCPTQYMWSYPRFRTRPPEELAAARG